MEMELFSAERGAPGQHPRSTGAFFCKLLQMFCAGNSQNAQAFVAGWKRELRAAV